VSKKCVIIMDRTQGSNATSTPAEKSGPSDQDSLLCQRFKKRREETAWNGKKIATTRVVLVVMFQLLTYVISCELFWNSIDVVKFVSSQG